MLPTQRPTAAAERVLFRGDLVTVRETASVERCATRHQVAFTRAASSHESSGTALGARVRLVGAPPRPTAPVTDPTRVLLLNLGDAPPARWAEPATRTVIGLARDAASALGVERARPFARAQATVPPRVLLRLHALRAALAPALPADVRAMAVEETALALVAEVLAAPAGDVRRPRRRREIVAAAREILARAPGRTHHLADVADALGVSPSHLAHVFSAEVGMPLHRHLLHLRLAVALERLADGDPQLSALALDLGFATHSHFSAAFRRWCGMTPAAARAMLAAGRTHPDVVPRRAAS